MEIWDNACGGLSLLGTISTFYQLSGTSLGCHDFSNIMETVLVTTLSQFPQDSGVHHIRSYTPMCIYDHLSGLQADTASSCPFLQPLISPYRAVLRMFTLQSVLKLGIVLTQVQDPAIILVEHLEVCRGPLIESTKIHLGLWEIFISILIFYFFIDKRNLFIH